MYASTDIDWVIDDEVRIFVTKQGLGNYSVQEVGGEGRHVTISYTPTGRMLFDGQDIETEAFMAFVGLLDAADEVGLRVVYFGDNWMTT